MRGRKRARIFRRKVGSNWTSREVGRKGRSVGMEGEWKGDHRDDVAAFAMPSFVPRIIEWPRLRRRAPLIFFSLAFDHFRRGGQQLDAFPSVLSNAISSRSKVVRSTVDSTYHRRSRLLLGFRDWHSPDNSLPISQKCLLEGLAYLMRTLNKTWGARNKYNGSFVIKVLMYEEWRIGTNFNWFHLPYYDIQNNVSQLYNLCILINREKSPLCPVKN